MRSHLMRGKNNERSTRGRSKHRSGRRDRQAATGENRRTVFHEDEEETGNDTMVEYTSEEGEYHSESEDDYGYKRRVPPKRTRRSCLSCFWCCSCSKARMRCWHECMRDFAIILILILLIFSTLKDSQLKAMMRLYEQAYNYTHSVSDNVQRRYHSRGKPQPGNPS